MARGTVHRYLATLFELGYLEQGAGRKYRLGLKVTDLGMSALNATGLAEHAGPYLEDLRHRTSYTVGIGVLEGEDLLVVHQAVSFRRWTTSPLRTGSRAPAYATAAGKLLLAHLPDEDRAERLRAMKPKRHGPKTIIGKQLLADEFDRLRDEPVAVDDEEHAEGVLMLAAAVRNEARVVVAAVDVVVPSAAMDVSAFVDALGPHVIATADHVSARLGYRRDDESLA
jgi:DNA-binding IclR family transcriptional regulator